MTRMSQVKSRMSTMSRKQRLRGLPAALRGGWLASIYAMFAVGCATDPAPSATIRTVTPDQLMPDDDALDDLTISLRYADGDGDLGGGVVEVTDCRDGDVALALEIPPIAAEVDQPITGTLTVHINDVGAVVGGALPAICAELGVEALAADTAVFCVVLEDVAGHRGGGDCTKPITLGAR